MADIYVIGGAAMALAYDTRRAARDIDAVFQPHGIVLRTGMYFTNAKTALADLTSAVKPSSADVSCRSR